MLTELHIKNIAVIDELTLSFGDGFHVLTGETGAGKSIIIDSINMVLGERSRRELIRTGEVKAVVEALFQQVGSEAAQKLAELGIEAEDGAVLLYRDLNAEGKSVCRMNGQLVTAAMLREVARLLINIHGQQDNQALLVPAKHVSFLDSLAGNGEALNQYQALYVQTKELLRRMDACNMDEHERALRADLLQFQANEIGSAALKAGEEEEIGSRLTFVSGANKIMETLDSAREVLYHGSDMQSSVHDGLAAAVDGLAGIAEYDPALDELYQRLNQTAIELDDIIDQLRSYGDSVEYDPAELEQLQQRLDLIHTLKRKYGGSVEAVLDYGAQVERQLREMTHSDELQQQLQQQYQAALEEQKKAAQTLTRRRTEAARQLEQRVMEQLKELDMGKVRFGVSITPADLGPTGQEKVEFLISTNPGEPLKPLTKIASGGEMSRIMLALKCVLADSDQVGTLIFDEIDTGVSGRAAQRIAEKLCMVSRKKQVLCITHLPQIACMADRHFFIEKGERDGRTSTRVTGLDGGGRAQELARMIGGAYITETTLQSAEEMLRMAEELKES